MKKRKPVGNGTRQKKKFTATANKVNKITTAVGQRGGKWGI